MKMKKIYNYSDWIKMVEQAKQRGKLTEEEYQKLKENDEDTDYK